jgi:two-component system, OmpR family, KDP operon response regulator KdpE
MVVRNGKQVGLARCEPLNHQKAARRLLVQHAGKVLTHKFLLGELWEELVDAQYLRVYVRQLRQKIEADPERPQYVLTETGIGYRLRAPD